MGTATSKLYKTPHSERGDRAFCVEKHATTSKTRTAKIKQGCPKENGDGQNRPRIMKAIFDFLLQKLSIDNPLYTIRPFRFPCKP